MIEALTTVHLVSSLERTIIAVYIFNFVFFLPAHHCGKVSRAPCRCRKGRKQRVVAKVGEPSKGLSHAEGHAGRLRCFTETQWESSTGKGGRGSRRYPFGLELWPQRFSRVSSDEQEDEECLTTELPVSCGPTSPVAPGTKIGVPS